jgi:hypothetical protein
MVIAMKVKQKQYVVSIFAMLYTASACYPTMQNEIG